MSVIVSSLDKKWVCNWYYTLCWSHFSVYEFHLHALAILCLRVHECYNNSYAILKQIKYKNATKLVYYYIYIYIFDYRCMFIL